MNFTAQSAKENIMKFEQAITIIKNGGRVTRREWNNPDIFGTIVDGKLMIKNGIEGDGKFHPWILSDGDMFAEDWTAVAEPVN
jgi:hypothetical protein